MSLGYLTMWLAILQIIKYRQGENMQLYGDITKAKKLLGWKPKIDLQTGLRKTINSIKKNS